MRYRQLTLILRICNRCRKHFEYLVIKLALLNFAFSEAIREYIDAYVVFQNVYGEFILSNLNVYNSFQNIIIWTQIVGFSYFANES